MRAFLICYVLVGLAGVAGILNHFVEKLMDRKAEMMRRDLERISNRGSRDGEEESGNSPMMRARIEVLKAWGVFAFCVFVWTVFFAIFEACSCGYGEGAIRGCVEEHCSDPGTGEVVGRAISWMDALYMAIIT